MYIHKQNNSDLNTCIYKSWFTEGENMCDSITWINALEDLSEEIIHNLGWRHRDAKGRFKDTEERLRSNIHLSWTQGEKGEKDRRNICRDIG